MCQSMLYTFILILMIINMLLIVILMVKPYLDRFDFSRAIVLNWADKIYLELQNLMIMS